jgi:putative ABC transport system permease protein
MLAGHRLALRIARREALRYKGRSALSITLLGLPLLGVAIAASAYDTTTLSPEESAELYLGSNEAYFELADPGQPIDQGSWDSQYISWYTEGERDEEASTTVTEAEILNELPIGTWMVPYSPFPGSGEEIDVATPNGMGAIYALGYNLSDDAYDATGIEYLEGSAPIRNEVVLSEAAADHLELGVGDDLVVHRSVGSDEYEISGIVEVPWDINGRFAIGPAFPDSATGWLVDAPSDLTDDEVLALNAMGVAVWSQAHVTDPPPGGEGDMVFETGTDDATLALYALILTVVLMEVILLAGPAFAISARRRVREFALMSANGATPAQIRNTVLAGGLLFGVIAAVVAVALGIAIVAATRPLLEELAGHRTPSLQIMPALQLAVVAVAIGTGLLSALAAALSASRTNVVAALTGRTPRHKGSKRWLVIGLVLLGLGLGSGFAGVATWKFELMSAAVVLAQLGLVACTPAFLGLAAKLGRWLPLSPRMALREAGRNRGSAAPAIAAVLGVVAAGMAFSVTVTSDNVRNEAMNQQEVPQGTMTLSLNNQNDWDEITGVQAPADWDAGYAEVEPLLSQHLDDLELTEVPMYKSSNECVDPAEYTESELVEISCSWDLTRPEENVCPYWNETFGSGDDERAAAERARGDARCDETPNESYAGLEGVPASADPTVVATYTQFSGDELDAAVAHLEAGGVLVSDKWAVSESGTAVFVHQLWLPGLEEPERTRIEIPAMLVDDDLLGDAQVFLSPAAAEQLGLVEVDWERRYLVDTSTPVDGPVQEAISASLGRNLADGSIWPNFRVVDNRDMTSFYMMLIVAGLCALIALGSTAVSTGLIIAEQRRDMTTLAAVGAAPGLRKRFAMWQTIVIALFGACLGTGAGLLGYALIREALNRPLRVQYPFQALYGWELPWLPFVIMLVAVPVLAAVGALVFTRAKLPSERRLT